VRAAAIAVTEGGRQGVFARVPLLVPAREAGQVAECLEDICEKLGLDSKFEIEDDSSILTLGLLPLLQVYMRGMEKGYDAGVEDDNMDTESDVSTPSDNPDGFERERNKGCDMHLT